MSTIKRSGLAEEAVFPPGLRVEIRNAEWGIKRADLTSSGPHALPVTNIPELVRGYEPSSLTEIDRVKPLHPGNFELVTDTSPIKVARLRERE
jgi:hypothetical protein